jgi:uncharacterized protein YacL
MAPRLTRVPSIAVESLRLLVVLFGAGIGYEVATRLGALSTDDTVLGSTNGLWLGAAVGAMLGYVLGGVVARLTLRSLDRGERALDGMQSDQLLASGIGAISGAAVAAVLCWPVFLFGPPLVVLPTFAFVVLVCALFGARIARARHGEVLARVGPRAGLATRAVSTSSLPRIVDTSIAIDGRVLDVVRAGFLHGRFLVPQPVIDELQSMADASDEHRRVKGRRGLEVLETLRREQGVELTVLPDEAPGVVEVDAKLVRMSLDRGAALLTLDTNLAKAAALSGVQMLNLHQLALALRPPVVVGDDVIVHLLRPGKEAGQGVGFLDDGTMVVAENARERVGEEIAVVVTSVLTTANGRMVFARPAGVPMGARH